MKKRTAGIRIALGAYFLVLAVIVFLADRNGTRHMLSFIGGIPYGDKLGHFCLMGGLSFLANLVFESRIRRFWFVRVSLVSLFVAAIVTIEEASQIFVAGRSFDLADLLVDYLGIVTFGDLAHRIGGSRAR
jgi:VanZ family protein